MKKKMLMGLGLSLMMACSGEPMEAGDESEALGAQESALTAAELATATARLNGLAAVVAGSTATAVRAQMYPGLTDAQLRLRPDDWSYVNALWDFQKAFTGKNPDGGAAKGTLRRANMVSGNVRVQALLKSTRAESTLKAKTYVLERDITKILLLAKQEVDTAAPAVPFFFYSKTQNLTAAQRTALTNNLVRIAPFLAKIPAQHQERLDAIFIVDQLPGGRLTGGGFFPPTEVSTWLGKMGSGVPSANNISTNVPDVDINDYALNRGRGIVALTTKAMLETIAEFTLVHESAHSVNKNYAAIQVSGDTVVDKYKGLYYPLVKDCKPTDPPDCVKKYAAPTEYAAEAYARYFINKNNVCRTVAKADPKRPVGESDAACNARIVAVMDRAPAFQSPVVFPLPANAGLPALSLGDFDLQDHLDDFDFDLDQVEEIEAFE